MKTVLFWAIKQWNKNTIYKQPFYCSTNTAWKKKLEKCTVMPKNIIRGKCK